MIKNITDLLPDVFLIIYMFSIGLETARGNIIQTLRSTKLAVPSLLLNLFLTPVVAFLLVFFIELHADFKTGVLLLGIAPGGFYALNFGRISKGNVSLAIGLTILLSMVGIVVTPILVHFFFGAGASFTEMYRTFLLLLILILIPISFGKFIADKLYLPTAQKTARWINGLSILLFVAILVITGKEKSAAMGLIGIKGFVVLVLFVVISGVSGWILGGKEKQNKAVMAISTSLRNVGVCLPIAMRAFPSSNVYVPLLAFLAIAIPLNFLFSLISKRLHKPAQRVSVP